MTRKNTKRPAPTRNALGFITSPKLDRALARAAERAAPEAQPSPRCTGPECTHAAVATGLCHGHLKQKARGQALRPLRARGSPLASLTLRLAPEIAAAVEKDRDGARAALAAWAKGLPAR